MKPPSGAALLAARRYLELRRSDTSILVIAAALDEFAAEAVARERERCAKLAENYPLTQQWPEFDDLASDIRMGIRRGAP